MTVTINEQEVYGMTRAEIDEQFMESITAKMVGNEMVIMSILSDCQTLMSLSQHKKTLDDVRKNMNICKYILSKMLEAKRA